MYKLILAILFLLLIASAGLFFLGISNVEVVGGNGCVDQKAIIDQFRGKNLLTISPKTTELAIKESYKCVKFVTVQKKYPTILKITVEIDRPIVKVGDKNIYLTENGFVLENADQKNLPAIFFDREVEFKVGEKLADETSLFTLLLISQIEKTDFVATSARILNPGLISVYNRENQAVIFTSEKEAEKQVDALQLVLSESRIDPSKIEKIDLRFEKPTITYKE